VIIQQLIIVDRLQSFQFTTNKILIHLNRLTFFDKVVNKNQRLIGQLPIIQQFVRESGDKFWKYEKNVQSSDRGLTLCHKRCMNESASCGQTPYIIKIISRRDYRYRSIRQAWSDDSRPLFESYNTTVQCYRWVLQMRIINFNYNFSFK